MTDDDYITTETPDCWKFVQFTNLETGERHTRILCSWYGGYGGGDSWNISSGNLEVQDCGEWLRVPQHSGSVYCLYKNRQKMSAVMATIFKSYSGKAADLIKFEVLDYEVL